MNFAGEISHVLREESAATAESHYWEEEAKSLSKAFGPRKEELVRKIAVARATSLQAPCWQEEAMWQIGACMTQIDQEQLRVNEAHCQAHDARTRLSSLQKEIKKLQKDMGRAGWEMRDDGGTSAHGMHGNAGNAMNEDITWCSSDFTSFQMDEDVEEDALPDGPVSVQDAVNGVRYTSLPRSVITYNDTV